MRDVNRKLLGTLAVTAVLVAAALIWLYPTDMMRGLDISCGCFGSYSINTGFRLVTMDLVILGSLCLVACQSKAP